MSDAARTDTAHQAWDARWRTEAGRADWLTPEADVLEAAKRAYDGGARRALDLGCGVGRHALMLARMGYETCALDGSENGLDQLRSTAAAEGVSVDAQLGMMTELPYPDGAFDYVLSFNVIYHGDGDVVRKAISEIRRVLTPGGLYQGTMLSKRNANFGVGEEVAPDTWVRADAAHGAADDSDKVHPHFYCDAAELTALFQGFELWTLEDRLHSKPGSWHWHLTAERRA